MTSSRVGRSILRRWDPWGPVPRQRVLGGDLAEDSFDGIEVVLPADRVNALEEATADWTAAGTSPLPPLAIALERLGADPIEAVAPIRVCLKHAALWGACVCSVALPPVRRNGKTAVAFPRCQEALNFADVLLRRLRLEAEAAGVPLALEAAAGGCLLSPVELRELIDGACSWAVGACLDWTTVTRVGDFADWCETLARRVHCVRIPADQGRGPGEEAKRLADHVQNVLDRIAYPGPVVVRDVVGG